MHAWCVTPVQPWNMWIAQFIWIQAFFWKWKMGVIWFRDSLLHRCLYGLSCQLYQVLCVLLKYTGKEVLYTGLKLRKKWMHFVDSWLLIFKGPLTSFQGLKTILLCDTDTLISLRVLETLATRNLRVLAYFWGYLKQGPLLFRTVHQSIKLDLLKEYYEIVGE